MSKTFTPQELAGAPTIRLCGKDWPIPLFGPRQNRRIVPSIHLITRIKSDAMKTEDWDQVYSAIYVALTRAHPEIKESDFMDWEITIDEAFACIPVIAQQTGLMKFSSKEADDSKGEETAAISTGTSSSPESPPEQDGSLMPS